MQRGLRHLNPSPRDSDAARSALGHAPREPSHRPWWLCGRGRGSIPRMKTLRGGFGLQPESLDSTASYFLSHTEDGCQRTWPPVLVTIEKAE